MASNKEASVRSRRKILNPMFHLQTKEEDDSQLSQGMIKVVLKTGQLNLSGRGLANVPPKMFTMYKIEDQGPIDLSKPTEDAWWSHKPLIFLDLSSNVLKSIPEDLGMFEDLTTLNLQDNNLAMLPSEIGRLTRLTKLNISRNKLTDLPGAFYKLTELQNLNLSYNSLEMIAPDIGDLVMLQALDLSHNCINSLPPGIGFVVRLTNINISHNKLTELPPDIANLRVLHHLDVTHNNLESLPRLGELRRLQTLHALHNDIAELPDFEGSEHLQELYFGNNFIKEVSADFCENVAPQLKILDLRDNKISTLPDEIAMLQHMIRLDLTNNELQSLPNSMGFLPHLQNLQIEGNILRNLRQDVIKGGTCRILKHLRGKVDQETLKDKLNVLNNTSSIFQEGKLFPDKYAMKNAKALNLSMKDLATVPDNVFKDALDAEVVSCDVCKNKLQDVPQGLNLICTNLLELNLSQNHLKSVPNFLSTCVRLQYMELSRNLLTDLPECFGQLSTLRELVLSNNQFSNIPSCVYNLDNLEILLVADNKLKKIDVDNLKFLKRLATLDLSNNNIDQVPPELGNMKQIRTLEIKGNCFRQPRYAILEQGTDSILSYLRDRIPQ